jgi:hypothetical protein
MRFVDLAYAAAIGALLVWLALGAPDGPRGLGPDHSPAKTLAPVSAPGEAALVAPAAPAASVDSGPPRLAASATIDTRQFEILLGDGPPPWSVAVSVDD